MTLMLALLCAVFAVAMMAAVLSSRFDDGLVGKAGLIIGALGFGAAALQMVEGGPMTRPLLLGACGLTMALFAPAVRPWLRRLSRLRDSFSERHP